MKKILAALALTAVTSMASAADFGLVVNRDSAGTNRNSFGATIGQKFGKVGVEGGFERFSRGNDQDRWSLLGSYDVVKFGKTAALSVKGGGAYLNNQHGKDGYALLAGAGLTVPLTKSLAATVDYRYQWGQERVKMFNGSTVGAGLKYSF